MRPSRSLREEDFTMAKKEKKPLSRKQIRRRRRRRLLVFELIFLTFLVAGLFVWTKLGMVNYNDIRMTKKNDIDQETQEMLKGFTNIACFGIDNRSTGDFDTGHSDSIMVVSINNDTKEVRIISVYRDTLLEVKEGSLQKATNAYQYGGPQGAIDMLNTNFDLDITDYVSVDFRAVAEAVDAVGGVEIDVTAEEAKIINQNYLLETAYLTKRAMNQVSPGLQTLDGAQATAYCRVRYTSGNDFKRAERQRLVVSKLVEKAKQASLLELNDLINAVLPYIGSSLSPTEILSLGKAYKDYELVDTAGFPFSKRTATLSSKGSVVVPTTLESNVRDLYVYLFNDEEHTISPKVTELSQEIEKISGFDEEDAVDYGY